jgi:hypothetical protein
MEQQKYINDRVEDQINWYEKKSALNKKLFLMLKVAETFLALLIPLLTGFIISGTNTDPIKITIGLLGVIIAAIANLITLFKYQENWIQYRTMAELLKHEKFLFLSKAGPYKETNSFPLFVERIENYLNRENTQWSSYIKAKAENPSKE